jgi:hypothetical protein
MFIVHPIDGGFGFIDPINEIDFWFSAGLAMYDSFNVSAWYDRRITPTCNECGGWTHEYMRTKPGFCGCDDRHADILERAQLEQFFFDAELPDLASVTDDSSSVLSIDSESDDEDNERLWIEAGRKLRKSNIGYDDWNTIRWMIARSLCRQSGRSPRDPHHPRERALHAYHSIDPKSFSNGGPLFIGAISTKYELKPGQASAIERNNVTPKDVARRIPAQPVIVVRLNNVFERSAFNEQNGHRRFDDIVPPMHVEPVELTDAHNIWLQVVQADLLHTMRPVLSSARTIAQEYQIHSYGGLRAVAPRRGAGPSFRGRGRGGFYHPYSNSGRSQSRAPDKQRGRSQSRFGGFRD